MVEWRGIGNGNACASFRITREILRDGDQFFDPHISILAKPFQSSHILFATDIQRIIDRDENPSIIDQRTDLVDDPRTFVYLIHFAFWRCRKEWGIDDDAIKRFV